MTYPNEGPFARAAMQTPELGPQGPSVNGKRSPLQQPVFFTRRRPGSLLLRESLQAQRARLVLSPEEQSQI